MDIKSCTSFRSIPTHCITKCIFDKSCPTMQSFLTPINKSISNPVKWDDFYSTVGILQHSYTNSLSKFNTYELEFHYTNAEYRQQYNSQIPDNVFDNCNILNIFKANDLNSYFMLPDVQNCFFGVTFKTIKLKPQFFSIQSIPSKNSLVSFVFEAFNEEENKWDELDKVDKFYELSLNGSTCLFPIKTDKCYSTFMIRQTNPGKNGFWGFAITSFEIYGVYSPRFLSDIRESGDFLSLCQDLGNWPFNEP